MHHNKLNMGLKYFTISGNSIETKAVIAIDENDVNQSIDRFKNAEYELTECDKPENATFVLANKNNSSLNLAEPYYDQFGHGPWDGPNCERCINKFKNNEWCAKHHNEKNCYRFKLEK